MTNGESMTITRIETTIIPHTVEGKKFAEEYAKRLKKQNCLCGYEEDTVYISITAKYILNLKKGEKK